MSVLRQAHGKFHQSLNRVLSTPIFLQSSLHLASFKLFGDTDSIVVLNGEGFSDLQHHLKAMTNPERRLLSLINSQTLRCVINQQFLYEAQLTGLDGDQP